MSLANRVVSRYLDLHRRLSPQIKSLDELAPGRVETEPTRALLKRAEIRGVSLEGRPVLVAAPRDKPATSTVVYWHGGGYINPMLTAHWNLIDALMMRSGAQFVVPGYGLAPQHTIDDAIPLIAAVHEFAVHLPCAGKRLVVAGDSAGGGLSLAHAIRARDSLWHSPDALVLCAPWVDVSMTNPQIAEVEKKDVMLRADRLAVAGRAWAGARDVDDPLVSPLKDTLDGLPPITILQGGRDILMPDALALADKAVAAGTSARVHLEPNGFHVYIGATFTPEAKRGLDTAARVIRG